MASNNATPDELKTKRGTWYIDSHHRNIIGQGAYGIVYKATDSDGRPIAAKRVDTKDKRRLSKISTELEKLIGLDHPNIVGVFDVHRDEDCLWIIMELCECGDFNKFLKSRTLTMEEQLDVMIQLAQGVDYLHQRNVIHRDIKPLNILVACDNPILVKLTDFDVSKFLDESYSTSAMSTDVGTLAFKAPEFFQKVASGKLRYHRNVDEYALGLTLLAMIQWAGKQQDDNKDGTDERNKLLLPQIETPRDDSERFAQSVGQLIAERIKYKVGDLNIVNTNTTDTAADAPNDIEDKMNDTVQSLKLVIQYLTHVEPESRLSAANIVKFLKRIKRESTQKTPKLKLDRIHTFDTRMDVAWSILKTGNGQLSVYGEVDDKNFLRVLNPNGEYIRDIRRECEHDIYCTRDMCRHPRDGNHFLEACSDCGQIRSFDTLNRRAETVCEETHVCLLCPGPLDKLIGLDHAGTMHEFEWIEDTQQMVIVRTVPVSLSNVWRMAYVEKHDILILLSQDPGRIKAVRVNDGSTLWEFNEEMYGKEILPHAVCHDSDGRVYISNIDNNTLLIFDSQEGELLQTNLLDADIMCIIDMCWNDSQPHLTLLQGGRRVSLCDVTFSASATGSQSD